MLLHKPYFYVSVVEINRAEMREIDNIIRKKYSDFIVDTQVRIAATLPFGPITVIRGLFTGGRERRS